MEHSVIDCNLKFLIGGHLKLFIGFRVNPGSFERAVIRFFMILLDTILNKTSTINGIRFSLIILRCVTSVSVRNKKYVCMHVCPSVHVGIIEREVLTSRLCSGASGAKNSQNEAGYDE